MMLTIGEEASCIPLPYGRPIEGSSNGVKAKDLFGRGEVWRIEWPATFVALLGFSSATDSYEHVLFNRSNFEEPESCG